MLRLIIQVLTHPKTVQLIAKSPIGRQLGRHMQEIERRGMQALEDLERKMINEQQHKPPSSSSSSSSRYSQNSADYNSSSSSYEPHKYHTFDASQQTPQPSKPLSKWDRIKHDLKQAIEKDLEEARKK